MFPRTQSIFLSQSAAEMRKSGDPFEVDPLPRTFYYPSQQKVLPEDQRKICLSPNQRKEDYSKSPADEKFLQQVDHMKIHEIPTRENGTTDPDQSSSSKFDESWPSTERAMVSTPEADTEMSGISKTPSSEGSNVSLRLPPDSTLARYIHRFRHAPPTSRQARDHSYFDSGKGGEFWWLSSSPPSSSTPKEGTPPERLLGPSPRPSLSPKLKRTSARSGASPVSPISKTRSVSSPSKSSLEGLDVKTADLQQRARTLLEKSESTLESSSSEAHRPKRLAKQGPPRDRIPREAPPLHAPPGSFTKQQRQLQPHPAPPPEEDILYQWRLARKMERAQEQAAKWGPARNILTLGSTQPGGLYGASQVLQTTPIPLASPLNADTALQRPVVHGAPPLVVAGVPVGSSCLTTQTQTTFSTPTVAVSDREVIPLQVTPSYIEITSQIPTSSSQHSQMAVEQSSGQYTVAQSTRQATVVATERPLPSQLVNESVVVDWDKFEPAEVPSHMHLSCDILPCPHQKALIEKGGTDKIPLSSPVVDSILVKTNMEERETDKRTRAQRPAARESLDKRHIPNNEFKGARSTMGPCGLKETLVPFPGDTAREKPKMCKAGTRKSKARREITKGSGPTDVLSGVIGQVVSERLFSTPCSSTSSLTSSEESFDTRDPVRYHGLEQENANPDESSDNEFPEDEVLKMLHQRTRRYREQLRKIDNILNQQTSRPTS